ncbi:hypothetical protein [Thermoflavifilum thermophilum]|nr:hypothetical protein [Thermoflavifilum thermophilum]
MKRMHLGLSRIAAKVGKLNGRDIICGEFNKIPRHSSGIRKITGFC